MTTEKTQNRILKSEQLKRFLNLLTVLSVTDNHNRSKVKYSLTYWKGKTM